MKVGPKGSLFLRSLKRRSLYISMPSLHMVFLRSGQLQYLKFDIYIVFEAFWHAIMSLVFLVYLIILCNKHYHIYWHGKCVYTYLPLDFYSLSKMKSVIYCALYCVWHLEFSMSIIPIFWHQGEILACKHILVSWDIHLSIVSCLHLDLLFSSGLYSFPLMFLFWDLIL